MFYPNPSSHICIGRTEFQEVQKIQWPKEKRQKKDGQ
jgi:hypothetical protein